VGRNWTLTISRKSIKGRGALPGFLSRCAAHPSSLIPPRLQAWCRCYPFFLTTLHITMFLKVALTFLAVGALSVNALTIPVARSPAPEPDCEFPRPFSIASSYDLSPRTPSTAQELKAWMLKRHLSYELFSREPFETPPPSPPPTPPPPPPPRPPTIPLDRFDPATQPRPGTPTPLTRTRTGGTGRDKPLNGHRQDRTRGQ